MVADTEAAIWERILEPEVADLAPDAARSLIALDFLPADQARMAELAEKSQDGALSDSERNEFASYVHVSQILTLVQSKARLCLRKSGVLV